jgi:hypothetical protein
LRFYFSARERIRGVLVVKIWTFSTRSRVPISDPLQTFGAVDSNAGPCPTAVIPLPVAARRLS